MTEDAIRLEAFRRMLTEALEMFITHGQCGRIGSDGAEELQVPKTLQMRELFTKLRAEAKNAKNIRALATVGVRARFHALESRFWVDGRFRDYSEALLAFAWLERHGILDGVPLERAQGFVKF